MAMQKKKFVGVLIKESNASVRAGWMAGDHHLMHMICKIMFIFYDRKSRVYFRSYLNAACENERKLMLSDKAKKKRNPPSAIGSIGEPSAADE